MYYNHDHNIKYVNSINLYMLFHPLLWSPKFSELVNRRSIHQLAATYKTNKKTTVVFRRPSDGKVNIFLEDLELRATIISIKNLVPRLV